LRNQENYSIISNSSVLQTSFSYYGFVVIVVVLMPHNRFPMAIRVKLLFSKCWY